MNKITALDIYGVPWPHEVIDEDVEELVESFNPNIKEARYIPWGESYEFDAKALVKNLLAMTQQPEDTSLDATWDYNVKESCKDFSKELLSFDNPGLSSPSSCLEDNDDAFTRVQFSEVSISTANIVSDSGDSRQSSRAGRSVSDSSGFTSPPSFHPSDATPRMSNKALGFMNRSNTTVSWAFNGTDIDDGTVFGTEWLLAGDTKDRCLGWTAALKPKENRPSYQPVIFAPQAIRGEECTPNWLNQM